MNIERLFQSWNLPSFQPNIDLLGNISNDHNRIGDQHITFVKSSKNRTKLIHQGFVYEKRNQHKSMSYYRCEKRSECQAKLNMRHEAMIVSCTPHSHIPDEQRVRKLQLLNLIRDKAVENTNDRPSDIYDSVLSVEQEHILSRDQAYRTIQRQRKRKASVSPSRLMAGTLDLITPPQPNASLLSISETSSPIMPDLSSSMMDCSPPGSIQSNRPSVIVRTPSSPIEPFMAMMDQQMSPSAPPKPEAIKLNRSRG